MKGIKIMNEIDLQSLYIKLISINNLLKDLNQEDMQFTESEFDLIKKLIKR
jgi:hypothetical protein